MDRFQKQTIKYPLQQFHRIVWEWRELRGSVGAFLIFKNIFNLFVVYANVMNSVIYLWITMISRWFSGFLHGEPGQAKMLHHDAPCCNAIRNSKGHRPNIPLAFKNVCKSCHSMVISGKGTTGKWESEKKKGGMKKSSKRVPALIKSNP